MCAALRREPHFEKEPPSIREALAKLTNECAQRQGESHIYNTIHPQSVKPLQLYKRMCAALRREPYFENDPPSICETVFKL
eukprot:6422897-Pyramimonas_sp.AAC.1